MQCLSNQQWSERRKGIYNLLNLVQSGRMFNRLEIKRLTEIFTRLFQDPHGKVFSLYLDVLNEFVRQHKRDLNDWLYVLLTRLLTKLGSETLPSVYQKLCKCLEAVRSSFDLDLQFNILINFINDQQQVASQNLKVKVALLKYLQDIICLMEAADFHSTSDLKCAVSRIISLTNEPKSADIRKVCVFCL
jgi:CLIP-associating protein 1/2